MTTRSGRFLEWAQFAAVVAVCLNHLKLTLLAAQPGFLPEWVLTKPALVGIQLLFLSSGYLAQLNAGGESGGKLSEAGKPASLASLFLLLALPCYAIFIWDVLVMWSGDFGPSLRLLKVWPQFIALTHTWGYDASGGVSVGLPLNSANTAWLGSCLLFLALVHVFVTTKIANLRAATVWLLLLSFLLLHAMQFHLLSRNLPAITTFGTSAFGVLADDYSLARWMVEFSPFAYFLTFFTGTMLCRLVQLGRFTAAGFAAISAVGACEMYFVPFWPAQSFGTALIIVGGLAIASQHLRSPDLGASTPLVTVASTIRHARYDIFVTHLAFFQLFTSHVVVDASAWGSVYLLLRVFIVSVFIFAICAGLSRFVLDPVRRCIIRDKEGSDDCTRII